MTIRTHRQYSEDERIRIANEYDVDAAEVNELYPDRTFLDEWHKYAVQAFEAGEDFAPQSVRYLDRLFLRTLSRTTRGLRHGLPARYHGAFQRSIA